MLKIFNDQIQQFRWSQIGFDIDGNTVIGGIVNQVHFIMRARSLTDDFIDGFSFKNTIAFKWHDSS